MGILQKMFNFAYGHQVFDFQVYLRKRFLKYLMSAQKAFAESSQFRNRQNFRL